MTLLPKDVREVSSILILGTKALVSSNSLSGNPKIITNPPLTDWTIQFYLMALPSHKTEGFISHQFLEASFGTETINLQLDYKYSLSLPRNTL